MVMINLEQLSFKKLYGNRVPTTGNYLIGDIVINYNPTNDIYGWVCTESGTPGAWDTLYLSNALKGDTTTITSTGSSNASFTHGLGTTPKKVSVTPANIVVGDIGIKRVLAFNETFTVYFNDVIPTGEEITIHWIMGK